jgi:membrane fusion protein
VEAERQLFRPEALNEQQSRWLGGVLLVRPLALSWLTAGALAALVLLVVFLGWAQYTRKATVAGVVAPDRGLIRIVPSVVGTVMESRAAEGQAVNAGDVLFVIGFDRPLPPAMAQQQVRRSLGERRRSLNDAARVQQTLLDSRRLALERRIAAIDGELRELEAERTLQGRRLALAEESLARLQVLLADQFVSAAQLEAKSEEVLGLRAAAQAYSRQRSALERDRAELEGERQALPMLASTALGGLERDLAQTDRELAEQGSEQRVVIRSPQAGTLSTVLVEPGQSVTPSSALATLLPEGATLLVHLYAPSSAVGFVHAGQAVRLRFEAFPYQKFGPLPGHVVRVSRSPLASSELAALVLPAAAAEEPLFRITVALDEPRGPLALAPGMRLQADVLLERRRLVEWLFEPLLGLEGRL